MEGVAASDVRSLLADIPVLALSGGILRLAEALVTEEAIPRKATVDALHIAIATTYVCDYLLTWNCRRTEELMGGG